MTEKRIEVFQGEAKTVTLSILDAAGNPVDVATATMEMKAAEKAGVAPVLELGDDAFSAKGNGTAQMVLSAANTGITPGAYLCQFKTTFSAANIDINQEITLVIKKSISAPAP